MINCFEACVLVDGMENHSLVAAFCFVGDGAALAAARVEVVASLLAAALNHTVAVHA